METISPAPLSAPLIEMCILAELSRGRRFLEELEEDLCKLLGIAPSQLCLRLAAMNREGLLETYVWTAGADERFYYRATNLGLILLDREKEEWSAFKKRVDGYLFQKDPASRETSEKAQIVG